MSVCIAEMWQGFYWTLMFTDLYNSNCKRKHVSFQCSSMWLYHSVCFSFKGQTASRYTDQKIKILNPKMDDLEDAVPFQLGDFRFQPLIFQGVAFAVVDFPYHWLLHWLLEVKCWSSWQASSGGAVWFSWSRHLDWANKTRFGGTIPDKSNGNSGKDL